MDTEVIAALAGLIGISLGAFLGGIGYYLKTRLERMKNKKIVLFHLLEFRHQVKSSYVAPKELSDEYFKVCTSYFKRIGLTDNEEISESIRSNVEDYIYDLVAASKPNIPEHFIQSYEESLKNLCGTDPVLAFKLRGMERLHEITNAKEKYISNFNAFVTHDVPSQIVQFVYRELRTASRDSTEDLLKYVDKDLSAVAWSCGFLTWLACRRITGERSQSPSSFEGLGIETALEGFLSKIAEEAKALNQNRTNDSGNST
jgi:hypothetical protein